MKTALAAAAIALTAQAAAAQANGWYTPYVKGLKALDAAKYADAAMLLERAVSEDPRSARNKYIEGVFRTDYLPYYYLAVAYSKLGALDKAKTNLAKAQPTVPPQLVAQFNEIQRALGAAPALAAVRTTTLPRATPPAARTRTAAQSRPPEDRREIAADVIVTNGQAVVRRAPDVAFVTVAIETRAKGPREAQQQNAAAANAVIRRLTDDGIAREAMRTLGVRLEQEFDTSPQGRRTPRDFVARNAIEVTIAEVGRAGEIADAAVQAGATAIDGIRFDLKDRAAAEREAMRLAVADARALADAAASGAGRAIDRVIKIESERDNGIAMPRAFAAARAADAAPTPIEPGNIEIRARVTLTASMR